MPKGRLSSVKPAGTLMEDLSDPGAPDQELLSIDPVSGAQINNVSLPIAIGTILPLFDR